MLQNFNLPLTPPTWAIDETHRRIVLLLNHVLMQEPQAMERMARQKGRIVCAQWRTMAFAVVVTPAGLFGVADTIAEPDLSLVITDESPLVIAQSLMQGSKPAVRIDGDVQLAADVNWLVDHVRWDAEEDLARMLGDAPAHAVVQAVRAMAQTLQQFVGRGRKNDMDGPSE